jgi:hypothetical protein
MVCEGDKYPLGRNGYFYVKAEAGDGFGIQADDYTAANAFRPLACNFGLEASREYTETAQPGRGRSQDNVITGKQSCTWDMECYAETHQSGSAAQSPDVAPFIKAALGASENNADGVADGKFLPADSGNCLDSLNIVKTVPNAFSEQIFGAVVDSMTITASGGEPIRFAFSGRAYNKLITGYAKSNGDNSGTATPQTLQPFAPVTDVYQYTVGARQADGTSTAGSLVMWTTGSGSGTGNQMKATAYADEDAGTLTVGTGKAGNASGDTYLAPWYPTGGVTLNGKPLTSITGGVTITPYKADGSTLHTGSGTVITDAPITSLELSVENNNAAIDDECFDPSDFSGFIPGARDVSGTITMRVKTDVGSLILARRELYRLNKMVITLGDVDNEKIQITLGKTEWEPSSIEASGQDAMTVSIPFKAFATDATLANQNTDIEIEYI